MGKVHLRARASNLDAGDGPCGEGSRDAGPASASPPRPGGLRNLPRATRRARPDGSYKRLRDYGIIGNLRTVALVGVDGSIDWYCYPDFDSPSVFGAILDGSKGGRFRISTQSYATRNQIYFPDTNVLITRFLTREGVGEVTDYMPLDQGKGQSPRHRIIRQVEAVRGNVPFELECLPAFDYARQGHETKLGEAGAQFIAPAVGLTLAGLVPLKKAGSGVQADFRLKEGESTAFVLEGSDVPRSVDDVRIGPAEVEEAFRETVAYWRHWIAACTYRGRWREMVNRSALVLKLLTFAPTGAVVAAPTTGLPEEISGERNWDYRYTWIRDAASTIYALLGVGFKDEAGAFMNWLSQRITGQRTNGSLRPVYRIGGSEAMEEEVLTHLEGYRGSRPVRIGNAASEQVQLDIYGALMDAVSLYNDHGTPISYDLWVDLRRMLDWVCDHWREPDQGIWEIRGPPQEFVHSKMMCWVAMDRGIRLAEKRGFPGSVDRWRAARDAIYEEIMAKGWSAKRQAFVQAYGSEALDASALLMPLVLFMSPTDPRVLMTIAAIQKELASDHLVYRYRLRDSADGLKGEEGTFSLCSFWLVEALTRAGRLEEARIIFERMLGYANSLGLYAEEIGRRGEALGNFPQAFTHLGLITAAVNLDRALGESD
jgi:GH15 family glucan-1,4-alpha-glucosidase